MAVRATSSTQPGRLEPFIVASLLLHAVLLALFSRALVSQRYFVPMGEGAVVEVIPIPAAPQPSVAGRATPRASAPGGSGQATPRPAPPAAATVVAEKPRPATREQGPTSEPASGKAPQPSRPPAAPAKAPKASSEVLTSPNSPVAAAVASPARTEASGKAEEPRTGEEGARAQGAVTRPKGEGTGGVREGNPPAGPPQPDLAAAVVVDSSSPQYPKNAVTYGVEGRVVLAVTVGPDGQVGEVAVQESSGNAVLDTVARRWVAERWRFKPSSAGRAYQVSVLFEFAIQKDEQGRDRPLVSFRILDERVRYL